MFDVNLPDMTGYEVCRQIKTDSRPAPIPGDSGLGYRRCRGRPGSRPDRGADAYLITDGLVEDRRVLLDENLEKLRIAAQDAGNAEVEISSTT